MNLTILKGNLGQDPEIKIFESGSKKASFSLATTEKYKNKNGEMITDTDWHNIVFFGSVCDVIEKHVHKGDQIMVTGRIKYRSYENKDKQTVHVTEVLCDRFEFCGTAKPKEPAQPAQNNEGVFVKSGERLPETNNPGNQDELSDLPF